MLLLLLEDATPTRLERRGKRKKPIGGAIGQSSLTVKRKKDGSSMTYSNTYRTHIDRYVAAR